MNTIILFLDIIHHPVLFKAQSISETGFSLYLQVELTQLCPIKRASAYLRGQNPVTEMLHFK
jgi:hypothetical protein